VSSPGAILHLPVSAQPVIEAWIDRSVDALENTLVAIECLINPEAILIGGRLPAPLVDQLASRLNERLSHYESTIPAIVSVSRAALADDAPAVGAAILTFSHRFLPTRFALMKTSASG
jgi:predicted NBD/HSP70 family sugar kinase